MTSTSGSDPDTRDGLLRDRESLLTQLAMIEDRLRRLDGDASVSHPGSGSPRGATMTDVAARAGVSVQTVSNVFSGGAPVRASTRARVEAAAHELGYVLNPYARALRTGKVAPRDGAL